jgi:hypothetical protein
METLSLVNKVVKCVDSENGIDVTGLIYVMYPNFVVRDEIFFDYENNVVYTGNITSGTKAELEHGTNSFIALCSSGFYDIDFTNRERQIDVLYAKFGKQPSEEIKKTLCDMSLPEFLDYFKKFWVIGRSKMEEKSVTLYNLYQVLGKQRYDILKIYFQLREVYSDSTIFSGVLSFLEKASNPDSVTSQNGRYLKMLNDFRKDYAGYIIPIIQRVYTLKTETDSDREYRTLYLLMQLGKGSMV